MHQSKPFIHRITAFLLLSAFFLTQCALFSQVQKFAKEAHNTAGQPCILLADGTLPPPPPPPIKQL